MYETFCSFVITGDIDRDRDGEIWGNSKYVSYKHNTSKQQITYQSIDRHADIKSGYIGPAEGRVGPKSLYTS